jgi:hypothetical protein
MFWAALIPILQGLITGSKGEDRKNAKIPLKNRF